MKKGEGKENTAAVEESKVKKKVAGGKCWRGKWLSLLCVTGEISNIFNFQKKELAGEYL